MQKKLFNKFTAIAMTDVGLVREHNEDSILIDEQLGLLVVADGMGGHQAGEIASKEAIAIIQQMLRLQQRAFKNKGWLARLFDNFKQASIDINEKTLNIEKALVEANKHIYQLNIERESSIGSGMGTTIAGCQLISADMMLVFHIGDSRVYRFRNQQLQMLTKDHSALQGWHDDGCEGDRPKANVILRAVGPYPEVEADTQLVKLNEGDSFLICSDGLTDMLDDTEIEGVLSELDGQMPEDYCQHLLAAALERGGKDNVSIIWMAQD